MAKLPRKFYTRPDVVQISRELIGKRLMTRFRGHETGGVIVETEAYAGPVDRASHAYGGRRTRRNEPMYYRGGTAYVYLCYGIHHLFNVVTNTEETPHAVLIRAIEPTHGVDHMLKRRRMSNPLPRLTAGPGSLAAALGIRTQHSGLDLLGDRIWIEDAGRRIRRCDVRSSPRVGIAYAGPDTRRPWRFRLKSSDWTSPAP